MNTGTPRCDPGLSLTRIRYTHSNVMDESASDIPLRVEYELTGLGLEMIATLESYGKWMKRRWGDIQMSRQMYDQQNSP